MRRKGKGCNAETFPEARKDNCGETSISRTDAKRKRTHTSVKNEEFTGEVTIEVKLNFGFPMRRTRRTRRSSSMKNGGKATIFGVMGPDVSAGKKKTAKKKGKK